MTARDIVARDLTAAEAVVAALTQTLHAIDELEEPEPVTPAPGDEDGDDDESPAKKPAKAKRALSAPEPSANGHAAPQGKPREKLVKIALALAEQPRGSAELVEATGIPQGSMAGVIARGLTGKWWAKTGSERGAPYELTDLGRSELLGE